MFKIVSSKNVLRKKALFLALFLTFTLIACQTSRLTDIPIPDAYDTKANFTEFAHVIYHLSDQKSRLYFRINTSGLLYSKQISDQIFKAHYKIHYELYNKTDTKKITDSLSRFYVDTLNYQLRKPLIDSIDLNVSYPGQYLMIFTITDLNRKNYSTTYVDIHKNNYSDRQNYLLRDTNGVVLFNSCISAEQRVRVISRNKQVPRLFVSYYKREFSIAPLPFIEIKEKKISLKPDSVFFLEMDEGQSANVGFRGIGIYHVRVDTAQKEGLSIFRFHKDFPQITTSDQLLAPLVYISTKNEFNDMRLMKNTKDAVDNFWLEKSGNADRAKEMIRKYYNRVVDANRYFTSYLEGWKTDRGLIYVVYGPPNSVYRNPNSETWIYGEDRNILSMTFIFNKVENPFTDNDFELNRTQEYKDTWYTAVDAWRQ